MSKYCKHLILQKAKVEASVCKAKAQFEKREKPQVLSGQKKGTKLYSWNSKLYILKNQRSSKTYFECRDNRKGCPGRIRKDEKTETVSQLKEHQAPACAVDETTIATLIAKTEMKQAAKESGAGATQQSLRSVSKKHGVSSRMAFGDMESIMRKRWCLNMPVIQQSAGDALAAMTNVPSAYARHFRCGLNGHYGTGLVFYAESQLLWGELSALQCLKAAKCMQPAGARSE